MCSLMQKHIPCSFLVNFSFFISLFICGKQENGPVDRIISSVLQLLDNEVIDNWKTCAQFFILLKKYATHVSVADLFIVRFTLWPITTV